MARSTNGFYEKVKRLPYKALLRRDEPFRKSDADELQAACQRIAGGGEYHAYAGNRGAEVDCKVICFATADQAAAMQAWIEQSGIANRPSPPKFDGPKLKFGGGTTE